MDAYVARPSGTPKGGVIVLQEAYGVNDYIRRVAIGTPPRGTW